MGDVWWNSNRRLTVYRLPTKENKLPFFHFRMQLANGNLPFSFSRLQQTNGSCHYFAWGPFSVYGISETWGHGHGDTLIFMFILICCHFKRKTEAPGDFPSSVNRFPFETHINKNKIIYMSPCLIVQTEVCILSVCWRSCGGSSWCKGGSPQSCGSRQCRSVL